MFACPATDDFFRSRIDHMIDLRHPLSVLSSRMPWQEIEARVAQVFSRKGRAGVAMLDLDLFGEQVPRTVVASNAGRPRVPLRTMIALLYLKHALNESDEGVMARWADTPRWQFFSGCAYYEDRQPCDATTLVKFRQLLGEEGVEELLAQTINVAVELKLIKTEELKRVIVDSTVQHKAIAHPTDSRLLEVARTKLVEAAKDAGIDLKQTFAKEGKELGRKAARYAHARQFKRMRRAIKRQRTIMGRLQREVDRKARAIGTAVREALKETLSKAARIVTQSGQRKSIDGNPKLDARHAPEVDCISKGKARTPYEFVVKVGIASTLKTNLIVGTRAFHGNPYDGHDGRKLLCQLGGELIERNSFQNKAQACMAVFTWIEGWNNPRRRHSGLGYLSPLNFEGATKPCSMLSKTPTCMSRQHPKRFDNQIGNRPRKRVNSTRADAPSVTLFIACLRQLTCNVVDPGRQSDLLGQTVYK